ncbi:uncharacterized protein BO80DRAFT_453838 [Aspergillus ibericus CBS 121593]|uniref:Uncharacterized protein n=1 Tax=Aspergillus ibericus CBS 121593 TaxID=1448316 RepID=A0A395H4Y1_9EURO|nr:hypothetical protein BO80DRAFT_453838 [Aspergillus ibericus CBS 121593]RAL02623.1 hypothetical protein BO80DRAFT_453838 [Aspergillus ibericus CBS 121593]
MASIELAEISFINQIRKSDVSSIFHTAWRGERMHLESGKCESAAFARLSERGLCDKGSVPRFYGQVEQINPVDASPQLNDFLEDQLRPNAILLEYILNIRPIDLSNFAEKRAHKLHQILLEYTEDTDRVLWIDFDRAQTRTPDALQPNHVEWLEEEADMMDYFVKALAADARDGRIYRTWACYYEYVEFRPQSVVYC